MCDLFASTQNASLRAIEDSFIFGSERVLEVLLRTQLSYLPMPYFGTNQPDLQPFMRKMVTTWMLEVCEEYGCEDQVFPLAVNYLDRFLSVRPISRSQLQLLAAACLFISSKLRQCRSLSLLQLVYLTDYSVTQQQIKDLELTVLHVLDWDIASVTGFDFIEQLLTRLPIFDKQSIIRRHSQTFVALCATEEEFMQTPAALVAGAAVSAAVIGMKLPSAEKCVLTLATCLHTQPQRLSRVVQRIEELVRLEMSGVQNGLLTGTRPDTQLISAKIAAVTSTSFSQSDTPTDTHFVRF